MDYIEDDFTDALIDAICEKSPRNWYTLVGENFDPDEETIVKESVFEYVHSSGIKLRPARPLTNSILYIYNPIGTNGCICVKRTSRAIDML